MNVVRGVPVSKFPFRNVRSGVRRTFNEDRLDRPLSFGEYSEFPAILPGPDALLCLDIEVAAFFRRG